MVKRLSELIPVGPMEVPFSALLLALREAKGLTIYAAAQRSGVNPTALSKLEKRGNTKPSFDTVRKLATFYGVTPDWFHDRMAPPK